jgi:hypothetical protein
MQYFIVFGDIARVYLALILSVPRLHLSPLQLELLFFFGISTVH